MVFLSDELSKFVEVHHDLLNSKIDVVLRGESYCWVVWVTNSEITVLCEHYQALSFLSNSLRHEACVVVETIDVAFVTSIEKDGSSLGIPIGVLNEISHLESIRFTFGIEVIHVSPEEELLGVIFP